MITVKSEKKPDNKDTAVHLTSVVPSAAYDCDLGGRSRLARTQAPQHQPAVYPVNGMSTDSRLPLDNVRRCIPFDSFPFGVDTSA